MMVRVEKIGMASRRRCACALPQQPTPSAVGRALGLLALAGALGACQPAPVLAPAPPRRAVVAEPPRPEVQPHAAKRHPVSPPCEPTDETGLSAAQKDALFQQFEAWQANGGKPGDAPAASRTRRAATVACRGRTP